MGRDQEQELRRQLWVDQSIQGTIVRRVALYWAACILFITVSLLWAATYQDPSKLFYEQWGVVWQRHWPLYVALLSLIPLTMWDALKLSHRIAGPVLRIRQQLARINDGQPFSELEFRGDDFWRDLATQVNQLAKKTLS